MQFFMTILLPVVGGGVTLVSSFMFLLRSEILLVIRANRYLVIARGKRGEGRYRVLKKGVHFRVPFWETVVGEAPRGTRTLKWDLGDAVFWHDQDECGILLIPAYVLSVRVTFTSNPDVIQRVARGELEPLAHLHDCVKTAIIQPGREPLQPQQAVRALKDWFMLHPADHGYTVGSVSAYIERL